MLVAGAAILGVGAVLSLNKLAHEDYLPERLATLIHAVHAVVTEFFAFIGVILSHLFLPLMGKWEISKNLPADPRPVLLVHGYLHNASAWTYLMPKLHYAGFRSIYTINLWPPIRCGINDYAKQIQEKVTQIAEETGQKEVIVIGHSMGGLAARRAALNLAAENSSFKISHVASIGSPFRGAWAALIGYFFGQNAKDLLPGSEFTTKLQEDLLETTAKTQFLEIGSKMDQLVSIDSARIPKENLEQGLLERKTEEIKDLGHLGLLYSPTVAKMIIDDWLQPRRSADRSVLSLDSDLDP